MVFKKRSVDGSAKCTLCHTCDEGDVAYAAVFSIPEDEVSILDAVEGVGRGYDRQHLGVTVGLEPLTVFTYIASESHVIFDLEPYEWYKGLVLAGARHHGFPSNYIAAIAAVYCKQDLDTGRRIAHENLLARIEK